MAIPKSPVIDPERVVILILMEGLWSIVKSLGYTANWRVALVT
jgi:hypothetical protein